MPNTFVSSAGLVPDYNPQAEARGAVPGPLALENPVPGTLASISDKLASKFGAIADRAAQIEGARAGKIQGNDPNFRPTGSTTLRGYAQDQAAVGVYASNLTAQLGVDMANLYTQHRDDPAGFAAAAAALKKQYDAAHVFPEIQGDFNQRFLGEVATYQKHIAIGFQEKQRDGQRAAMIQGLDASETARGQVIAAGSDPAAVRRQVGYSVADDQARIDQLVASGAYTAEQGAKLKLALQHQAASDVVIGEAGKLKSAEDVEAYRQQLKQDFTTGSTGLDADAYAKLDSALQRMAKSVRVGDTQAANDLKKQLDDINEREAGGFTPKAAEWATLAAQAHALGPAGEALFDQARLKSAFAAKIASQSPEASQALLDSLSAAAKSDAAPYVAPAGRNLPRGLRNNNPGNIKDGPFARGLPGYAGSDGTFARFNNLDAGIGAMSRLLGSYGHRGLNTVASVVGTWAPASADGNPTGAYVAAVSKRLGIASDAPIDMSDPGERRKLAQAMAEFENGRRLDFGAGGEGDQAANVGVSSNDAALLKWGQDLIDKKRKAIAEDPLGVAASDLGLTVKPIDPMADDVAAQVSSRVSTADAVALHDGRPATYLRPDEKERIKGLLSQGGDIALRTVEGLTAGAGPAAPAILKEIGNDAPEMAQAAAVSVSTGDRSFAKTVAEAIAARKEKGADLPNVPAATATTVETQVFGDALSAQDLQERQRTVAAARAWFSAEAAKRGIDAEGPEAGDLYKTALQKALRQTTAADGSLFGGVTSYRGNTWSGLGQVWVPSDVRPEKFEAALDLLADKDLAALPHPPVDSKGRPYSAADLLQKLPVRTPVGYAFGTRDPVTGKLGFVYQDGGGPFVLPWTVIAPVLRQRMPEAFK